MSPHVAVSFVGRFEPPRKKFNREGYASVWPAGATIFARIFSHEAHHRGQILMLAHQLGYLLPAEAWGGIWHWEKSWNDAGLATRPH